MASPTSQPSPPWFPPDLAAPWHEALSVIEGEQHRGVLDDAAAIAEAEAGRTALGERIAVSAWVDVELPHARVRGVPAAVGSEAVVLCADDGATWLVRCSAILGVGGAARSLPPEPPGDGRLARPSMGSLARDWCGLEVVVVRIDGRAIAGTLASVGADHVDVAGAGDELLAVPFASVAALRRR